VHTALVELPESCSARWTVCLCMYTCGPYVCARVSICVCVCMRVYDCMSYGACGVPCLSSSDHTANAVLVCLSHQPP
jgi:hypothetical protein